MRVCLLHGVRRKSDSTPHFQTAGRLVDCEIFCWLLVERAFCMAPSSPVKGEKCECEKHGYESSAMLHVDAVQAPNQYLLASRRLERLSPSYVHVLTPAASAAYTCE
uniref:Uncharacterized protein n=1 Tax=Ascaris lumbricoides TaxID=6252 RepID=A0A0M3HX73_ASCLU